MHKRKKMFIVIIGVLLLISPWTSYGTTLDISLTVDNEFYLYMSTDDSVSGELIGSGNDWQTTYSLSYTLTPGNTYYIHVIGIDWGSREGFLGEFSLSDTLFKFQNDTQTLLTNTTDWRVNNTGFGDTYFTPITYGQNGVSPWGVRPGISSSAYWIWDTDASDTVYFSTTITPSTAAVPEPSTLLLLGSGLIGLAGLRKRLK
jgi:hypothetical protein